MWLMSDGCWDNVPDLVVIAFFIFAVATEECAFIVQCVLVLGFVFRDKQQVGNEFAKLLLDQTILVILFEVEGFDLGFGTCMLLENAVFVMAALGMDSHGDFELLLFGIEFLLEKLFGRIVYIFIHAAPVAEVVVIAMSTFCPQAGAKLLMAAWAGVFVEPAVVFVNLTDMED